MRAVLRSEGTPIDEVAAVAGQGNAVAGLKRIGPGLGILARETTHADHGHIAPVGQDQAHLKEDLDVIDDGRRIAVVEALGAIAALKEESSTACRLGQLRLQGANLPRGY